MKFLKVILFASLCLLAGLSQAKGIETFLPDSDKLLWMDVKDMTPGAKVTMLMGNPAKSGPFIARIKLPANYTVQLHSHPVSEYDTVISGTLYLGTGDKVDMDKTTALPAGSFIMIPAHTQHYGMTKEETVIQISGVGPWGMIYPKG